MNRAPSGMPAKRLRSLLRCTRVLLNLFFGVILSAFGTYAFAVSTLTVGDRVVTYWPFQEEGPFAHFEFDSTGFRNTYRLHCEYRQFLWIKNVRLSTAQITNSNAGAEWRDLDPDSTTANAVFRAICAQIGTIGGLDEVFPVSLLAPVLDSTTCKDRCKAVADNWAVTLERVDLTSDDAPAFAVTETMPARCGQRGCKALFVKKENYWKKLFERGDTIFEVLPSKTNGFADLAVLESDFSSGFRRESKVRHAWDGSRYEVGVSEPVVADDASQSFQSEESDGSISGHRVAQFRQQGLEVYAKPDDKRWCRADISLFVQLSPDSQVLEGGVDAVVPQIGAAVAEQCPTAVAARVTVVRSNQPETAISKHTALRVRGWEAQPWSATSPVVRLGAPRVGWEAQCTDRMSLLDKAQRDPSKAPEWLRGAWDQAGQWKANTFQWIGETAAALSSGQWPGEYRARVADFEAIGGGLCALVRREIDYASAALGEGRIPDAGRYVDRAMDLLKRIQAADQAANAYYVSALDRATSHWEVVFDSSKIAFSVTLAAATAGGSLAPSGAGYFAAKYGLFNALEFWVDSQEMSLGEAAEQRAIGLVVDIVIDNYLGRALPDDFNRLVAQGQLEKADALLSSSSAELVQQLPAGLEPALLRQAAEQVLAETKDEAVRIAIQRVFLKNTAHYLTAPIEKGRSSTRDIGPYFGAEYLAKRGTPATGYTAVGGLGGGVGGSWGSGEDTSEVASATPPSAEPIPAGSVTPTAPPSTGGTRVELEDGSVLVGEIKDSRVPFKSSFGTIDIDFGEVQGFADEALRLSDDSVLKGRFKEGSVEIVTSRGSLTIPTQDIVAVFPADSSSESLPMASDARLQAGQGVLTGRVANNFGQPVDGATVRIVGTNLTTQTAADGSYKIPYVPGDFVVRIEGPGYDPTTFALKLAQASTYPVELKTLLHLPPRLGVFFWDKAGWSPLGECTLRQTSAIPNDGNIDFRGVRKDAYRVTGSPYRVISDRKPIFLAHTPAAEELLVYRVDGKGEIVTRTFGGGLGGFSAMFSDSGSSKGTSIAKAWTTQPFPNRRFLLTENQPGVYAVVDRSYKDACFMFQIGETPQQVRHLEPETPSEARTLNVSNKVVEYWASQSKNTYAVFRFDSKGYRNTYSLDCERKQFLWTENLQVSTGNVMGNSTGAQWRPMNPESTIANAVYETICPTILSGKTGAREGRAPMAKESTPVADASTEQALNLSRARRRQVQAWLGTLSYKPGPADGVFGKGTRQSIEAWQTASGLPPSGFLNAAQIERLGVEAESPGAQKIYWEAIEKTGSVAVLKEFVSLYPDGAYTALARNRIQALRQATSNPSRSGQRSSKPARSKGSGAGSKRYTPKQKRAIDAFNNL